MKKLLSVLLSVLMLFSFSSLGAAAGETDFGAYENVVILGIDGAGAFFDNTSTPNMDKIFAENSFVAHHAKTETESSSAQNWTSILTGVAFEDHRINNEIADVEERTSEEKYPTVFRLLREQKTDAVLTSVCHWNPINFGIIENDVGVNKYTGSDEEVCQKVIDCINTNMPNLMFVQFDDVDHYGHTIGFGTKAHLDSITVADGHIGRVYEALENKGVLDSTLFIVVSDHGGTRFGGHGGLTLGEQLVFVGVKGKTVNENNTSGVRNRDVAAITLYALGVTPDENMEAKVPAGLFDGSQEVSAFEKIGAFFEKIIMFTVNIFADLAGNF